MIAELQILRPRLATAVSKLIVGFVLLSSVMLAPVMVAQDLIPLKGLVKTYKGERPVPLTEVGIHGVMFIKTSKQGDFTLYIPSKVRVGYIVTFEVKDWIIMSPSYNGRRGSVPLPSPESGDVILLVSRRGAKADLLADASIEIMLLGATADFEKLAELRQQISLAPHLNSARPISVDYQGKVGESPAHDLAAKYFDIWTSDVADSLGIERGEIQDAILSWISRANSDFDRGLGLLYLGHLKSAISYLLAAMDQEHRGERSYRAASQALAFTYAIRGEYARAEDVLERESISGDYNVFLNLGYVLALDGQTQEALHVSAIAEEIMQRNGFEPDKRLALFSYKQKERQAPAIELMAKMPETVLASFVLGTLFLAAIVMTVVLITTRRHSWSESALLICRHTVAIAGSFFAGTVTGFIGLAGGLPKWTLQLSSGLAVFLVLYFIPFPGLAKDPNRKNQIRRKRV